MDEFADPESDLGDDWPYEPHRYIPDRSIMNAIAASSDYPSSATEVPLYGTFHHHYNYLDDEPEGRDVSPPPSYHTVMQGVSMGWAGHGPRRRPNHQHRDADHVDYLQRRLIQMTGCAVLGWMFVFVLLLIIAEMLVWHFFA